MLEIGRYLQRALLLPIILQDYLRSRRLSLALNIFGWLLRAVKKTRMEEISVR